MVIYRKVMVCGNSCCVGSDGILDLDLHENLCGSKTLVLYGENCIFGYFNQPVAGGLEAGGVLVLGEYHDFQQQCSFS